MNEAEFKQYLALPESGSGPGVLVLHAWWGLNDFIRGVCDRLAGEGFVALAPDMFQGQVATTPEGAERLAQGSDGERYVPGVVLAAADLLQKHPAVRGDGVGAMGFSYGAFWAAWLSAYRPEAVRAVTLFYGSGDGDFVRSRAAYQAHYAEHDPYEPPEYAQAFEAALKAAGRPAAFYTYPGTGHWFFESDRADAFDAAAAGLAWERTVAFLKNELGNVERQ